MLAEWCQSRAATASARQKAAWKRQDIWPQTDPLGTSPPRGTSRSLDHPPPPFPSSHLLASPAGLLSTLAGFRIFPKQNTKRSSSFRLPLPSRQAL